MNSILENWRQFWKELGPNQRVSLVLSTIFVLAAMIGLYAWAQKPDMRLLFGSVSPKDASKIVEELEAQGVPYELRAGGTAIFVPSDHVYNSRMEIASQGLIDGDAVGFEIFDKSTIGISDFVQRTNFIRAVQGEQARTIRQLDGVESARVMVVMPDNKLLLVNQDVKTTASVMVEVGSLRLPDNAVQSIQALVANAVEGLTVANVAVVDNQGRVLSKKPDENGLMGASRGVVEYRQQLENYFSEKVQSMLEQVVGIGNAVVRVSADIDSKQVSTMEENFDEDGAVLRRQTSTEDSAVTVETKQTSVNNEGEEEESSNADSSGSRTEEESRDRDQEYEIDRVVRNTLEEPGQIRRLTASVFIAAYREVPSGPDVPEGAEPVIIERSDEELESLRQMIANALGIRLEEPSSGSVALQEVPFTSAPSLNQMDEAEAGAFDPLEIIQYSGEVLGGLFALILFLVFLNLLKRSASQPGPLEQMVEARRTYQANRESESPELVTPEMLNELIKQKPENAGATLRNWLSGNNGSN